MLGYKKKKSRFKELQDLETANKKMILDLIDDHITETKIQTLSYSKQFDLWII